ncbi:unnamed protein product [Brachionus calyciflorus]|uniref:Snake toxin/toxin-like domain-containing protein n=1 Tax=Brachionus calyciflorus TaxID=104777 RepID=A0A814H315_9BILA|nr:unnamed protein product [Brachionus calyciflorus]
MKAFLLIVIIIISCFITGFEAIKCYETSGSHFFFEDPVSESDLIDCPSEADSCYTFISSSFFTRTVRGCKRNCESSGQSVYGVVVRIHCCNSDRCNS